MKSIWQESVEKPNFQPLVGDIKTDVLVIGGGMAGLFAAHALRSRGIDAVVAEAREICGGTTKNTSAKITAQHGAIYSDMIKRYGKDRTRLYLLANIEAVKQYKEMCCGIDCDFIEADSFVYSPSDRAKIEREVEALTSLGFPAKFEEDLPLPLATVGAVKMCGGAEFNPLKFAYSIARDLKIYENTEVIELTPGVAVTKCGKIKFQKCIVATHFPLLNRYGMYFIKMYQHRSYVLALRGAHIPSGMYVDASGMGLSFRGYKDMLLLGGGGHRTGKDGGGYRELRRFASLNYKDATEVSHFATQDCKTLDDIPYIGRYSFLTPWLYVATGFNKWGMSSAMLAADILADLLQDKKNEYASVFSPARTIWHKQLLVNLKETALGLLTPTVPRCSHLGCALKYNKQEHTWDCGCHGSRYTEDGRIIDNPAMRDIKPPKVQK